MGEFRYKPISENRGSLAVLLPGNLSGNLESVELVDANGNVIESGAYRSNTNDVGGGPRPTYDFRQPGYAYPEGVRVRVNQTTGEPIYFNPNEGLNRGESGPGGTSGTGGNFVLGTAFPTNNEANYPVFQPVNFPDVPRPDYKFTDPIEFSKAFAGFNKDQLKENFALGQDFSLKALDTELQGLKTYAPAAAALKREQISADNLFNQEQRLSQVNRVLPEAREDLANQRERSLAYAEGRLPDKMLDRALELGIRSDAADQATFAGFGARSAQASKISDLMSARERYQIGQYGEQLFGQNLQTKASLYLSPTEYSQAGSEIRVQPEVGAGRLTYQGFGAINEASLLSPSQALQTQVNQEQYRSGLQQTTDQFNAGGNYQAAVYNSAGAFTAGLGLFNYQTSFLAAQQSANQQVLDQTLAAQIQGLNQGNQDAGLANGQAAQTIQSTAAGTGIIPTAVSAITNALTPNNAPEQTTTPVGGAAADTTPVGRTSIDTSPQALEVKPLQTSSGASGGGGGSSISPVGVDSSAPNTVKFASPSQIPSGYTGVGSNSDGTVSAVRDSSYGADLERFARFAGGSSGSISAGNAAIADRAISMSTGLSYQPLPQVRPIALTSSGQQVYSTPAAATNGDYTLGAQNVASLGTQLALSGVVDPDILEQIGSLAGGLSDPNQIAGIEAAYVEKGSEGVAQKILTQLGGDDLSTPEGQQIAAGAGRIAELWPNLSPSQKTLAISSLSAQSIKAKTGKDVTERFIPGSDRSVGGKLPVGTVAALNSQGYNGMGLARNWNQYSAIADIMTGGQKLDATQTHHLMTNTGLIGFGPSGAASPIKPQVGVNAAPAFGNGAVVLDEGKGLPKGFVTVSRTPDNKVIALPESLADTSSLNGASIPPLAFKNAMLIGRNAHASQSLWGKPPARGLARGSAGGSGLVAGLNSLAKTNSAKFGAIVAYSLFNNTMEA